MQGGKVKSVWMVQALAISILGSNVARQGPENQPFFDSHICRRTRGCLRMFLRCGRTLANACQKPTKNGRGCISGVWEIQSNRKQPALRIPWGVWHIVWGGGFLPFHPHSLGDAFVLRSSLLPTCGCHASFQTWPCHALTPSGLASQTWPCHMLGSYKGWFLRNRCLRHVDVLKGGFFHSSSCHACLGQASVSLGAPRMPTNLLHHGSQNRIQKTNRNMAARKGPRLYKKQSGTQREKKHVLTLTLMLVRRKSACKTLCGQQQNSPMADPTFGSKFGSQNGAQAKT